MGRLRVAVLMGGSSSEREVSLSTGREVLASLDPARYDAFPVDTAQFGAQSLAPRPRAPEALAAAGAQRPSPATAAPSNGTLAPFGGEGVDVALICLHGKFGEDGTVQGLLELLGIPYTGSGVLGSALAMDKNMAKKVLRADGIPTPPSIAIHGRAQAREFLQPYRDGETQTASSVPCPWVVKPSRQGSTIGITIVRDPKDLAGALETALELDDEVIVEKFVAGVEITAPVLGNDELTALPLVEIIPGEGGYDYQSKYTPGATVEIVPARLTVEQTHAAQELAVRAHRSLGCRGFSRTDMIVAEDGIWVLEVNTIPGMTPTSLLPQSAAAAGIAFPELLNRMIELALEGRKP